MTEEDFLVIAKLLQRQLQFAGAPEIGELENYIEEIDGETHIPTAKKFVASRRAKSERLLRRHKLLVFLKPQLKRCIRPQEVGLTDRIQSCR